jgi:hypothetical protein
LPEGTSQRHRYRVTLMPTLLARLLSVLSQSLGLRRLLLGASVLMASVLLADAVWAQGFIPYDQQVARSWTLHRIAVIQAKSGDVVGAKNTVAEITESQCAPGPSEVTSVWFCNGMVMYDHPPAFARRPYNAYPVYPIYRDLSPARVPAEVPQGLPANYLAADPRHGAIVDFTDARDSYGTRVTSRRYADGYVVIETPQSGKSDR